MLFRSTPLHLALDRKLLLLADYLLSTGRPLPPDALFAILRSALPADWRVQVIRSLVDQGGDPSGLSADGNTLLHTTVLSLDDLRSLEVAKSLVGIGCDPFKQNAQGKTPLDLALDRKFPLVADYLLSIGRHPPPDALFAMLRSALPVDWRAQAIRSLVGQGANASGLSADGNTLLHATVLSLDDPRSLEVAKSLVGIGFDPFKQNAQGKTPLDLALDRKFPLLVDYLLSTGPLPPNVLFAILRSALPADWRVQAIRSLVGQGANASVLSTDGDTLLHATVLFLDESRALEVAKLLVGAGCDPFKRDIYGRMALHIALVRKFPLLADYLLSIGRSPPDALIVVLYSALPVVWRARAVCSLVGKGADICGLSMNGNTLLQATVLSLDERQALEVAKLLVGAGCDPSARNWQGKTALDMAAEKRFISVMKYILSLDQSLPDDVLFSVLKLYDRDSRDSQPPRGANRSYRRVSTLQLQPAVLDGDNGLLDIVKILVDSGCDPSQCDADGHPPMYFAVLGGHVGVVKYLLPKTGPLPLDLWHAMDSSPENVRDELRELLTGLESGVWGRLPRLFMLPIRCLHPPDSQCKRISLPHLWSPQVELLAHENHCTSS